MITAHYRPGGWHDLIHAETGVRVLTVRPVGNLEWGDLTAAFTHRWIPDLIEALQLAQRIVSRPAPWAPLESQRRWWRYQTPLGPAAEAASVAIGTNFHHHAGGPYMATWDYLGEKPPATGHTWEPLTAPGVTLHPAVDQFMSDLGLGEPWQFANPTYRRPPRHTSVAEVLAEALSEVDLTVEYRRWLPHRENRLLPMRLSDI